MDVSDACLNMIHQQLRTCGVLNEQILTLITGLPREDFVPSALREMAYTDAQLPLPHDQKMLAPREVGLILQSLAIKPNDTILEIGTGSGYLTALMAQSGKRVTSMDIFEDLTQQAQKRLSNLKLNNVTFLTGDGLSHTQDNHDVIVITGAVPQVPEDLFNHLTPKGRLLAFLGQSPNIRATLFQPIEQKMVETVLFETDLPEMISETIKQEFTF